jgi:hypothetical protein
MIPGMYRARTPSEAASNDMAWMPVSEQRPCPICATSHACTYATVPGGLAVACRQSMSPHPIVGGAWLHHLPSGNTSGAAGFGTAAAEHAGFPSRSGLIQAEAGFANPSVVGMKR